MRAPERQVGGAERRRQRRRCAEATPLSRAEPRYRSVLITWFAICPLVTTVLAAGQPLGLGDLPLGPRSVILTAIVVPIAVLWVVPALRRAFEGRPRATNVDARELERANRTEFTPGMRAATSTGTGDAPTARRVEVQVNDLLPICPYAQWTRRDLQVGEHAEVFTRPDPSERLVEDEPAVGDFEQRSGDSARTMM